MVLKTQQFAHHCNGNLAFVLHLRVCVHILPQWLFAANGGALVFTIKIVARRKCWRARALWLLPCQQNKLLPPRWHLLGWTNSMLSSTTWRVACSWLATQVFKFQTWIKVIATSLRKKCIWICPICNLVESSLALKNTTSPLEMYNLLWKVWPHGFLMPLTRFLHWVSSRSSKWKPFFWMQDKSFAWKAAWLVQGANLIAYHVLHKGSFKVGGLVQVDGIKWNSSTFLSQVKQLGSVLYLW